jgi:hypothetical protein
MAYTTEFVDEGRGVLHTGHGVVTGAEIIDGAARLLQAVQGGMPLRYGLVDFSGITQFTVSTPEVKTIARLNIATAEIVRDVWASIIAPSDHAFGMARMWEAYANATAWNTCVFRETDAARAWLGERLVGGTAGA